MTRDLAAELDALRAEVHNLAQTLEVLAADQRHSDTPAAAPPQGATHERDWVRQHTADLEQEVHAQGISGLITYRGYYESGARAYAWATQRRTAAELLGQSDEQVARVLATLGNKQRLAILKAILEQPASAVELVERLGMGTTGQVYHHLKILQAADLVVQEERGQFAFRGHRVQSLLMLLAGVWDMLNPRLNSSIPEDVNEQG